MIIFENIIIMIMIEIQYSSTALLFIAGEPMHTASKQWHRMFHLHIYHLKGRRLVVSYVQPVMQQYELTTV